jgi:hypothetical protein
VLRLPVPKRVEVPATPKKQALRAFIAPFERDETWTGFAIVMGNFFAHLNVTFDDSMPDGLEDDLVFEVCHDLGEVVSRDVVSAARHGYLASQFGGNSRLYHGRHGNLATLEKRAEFICDVGAPASDAGGIDELN